MAKGKAKLNKRQEAFCREFVKDFNATQAYIRAGYKRKNAKQPASELLTNLDIQAEIKRLTDNAIKRNDISVDRILQEMKRLAFSDIRKAVKWDEQGNVGFVASDQLDDDAAASITSVKVDKQGSVTLRIAQKEKALEMLGRYAGLFDGEKEESEEPKTYNLNVNISRKSAGKVKKLAACGSEDEDG